MAALRKESLFSLEIVVDRLSIPNVTCRFPSIVFRLLDYPALIIHHVEPEIAPRLKRKIQSDPHLSARKQIPELLEAHGQYFKLEKGKSCLLKISPTSLLEMLQSTPLYVMIVDMFGDVPKLVGNCTIPLDETMERLYEDIQIQGLSIPAVQGEKGAYGIYNLMGVEVGSLTVGFRMLSLGIAIMPHINQSAVVKPKEKTFELVTQKVEMKEDSPRDKGKVVREKASAIQKLLEAEEQEIRPQQMQQAYQPAPQAKISKSETIETQTMHEKQTSGTQTDLKKRKKQLKEYLKVLIEDERERCIDDIIVTNTVCPPPLYYNSEADQSHHWGLKLFEKDFNRSDGDGDSDVSESDTIREEDRFSDDDVDTVAKPVIKSQSVSLKSEKTTARMKTRKPSPIGRQKSRESILHKPHRPLTAKDDLKEFPVLNALLGEILKLKNKDESVAVIDIAKPGRVSKKQKFLHFEKEPPSQKTKGRSKSQEFSYSPRRSHSPGRERESVERFVDRMHTPRPEGKRLPELKHTIEAKPSSVQPVKKAVHSRSCKTEDHHVPSDKSWIGKAPQPIAVTKTNLTYGMTNTQRLRIAKVNQGYLKTLEKKEEERKKKWKATFQHTRTIPKPKSAPPRAQKPARRPVPTPRLSKTQSTEIPTQEFTITESTEEFQHLNLKALETGTLSSTSGMEHHSRNFDDTEEHILEPEIPPQPRDAVTNRVLSQEVPYQSLEDEDREGRTQSPEEFEGVDVGELLGLEVVVDHQFSDTGSLKSGQSPHSPVTSVRGMSYIPPVTSNMSPVRKYPGNSGRISMGSHGSFPVNGSYDSTAYLTQSQVPSQGSRTPSPTKAADDFYRSDSVSSYAPSGAGNYSDETFEDDTDRQSDSQHPLDRVQVAEEANFGYTVEW